MHHFLYLGRCHATPRLAWQERQNPGYVDRLRQGEEISPTQRPVSVCCREACLGAIYVYEKSMPTREACRECASHGRVHLVGVHFMGASLLRACISKACIL